MRATTPTPVPTVTPYNAELQGLLSLLTPTRQRLLYKARNFERPQVYLLGTRYSHKDYGEQNIGKPEQCDNKKRRKIIIREFPLIDGPNVTTALEDSPIVRICHQMKRLYADGNNKRTLHTMQQQAHEYTLRNDEIRMYISYTYAQRWAKSGYSDLELKFYLNHSNDDKHSIISFIPRDQLTPEQIREYRKKKKYINRLSDKENFAIGWTMTAEERDYYLDLLVYTCYKQIEGYINGVYSFSQQNRLIPDYTIGPEPIMA